jgi:V8-like Glu-specific endopeptidase
VNGARCQAICRLRGAVVAMMSLVLVAGCSAGPVTGHPAGSAAGPGGGASGYWTRVRLERARPYFGLRSARLPGQSATARPGLRTLRVGALFVSEPGGDHFCTASVVDSPGQDLLITAAHCINGGKNGGYRNNIVFIPGYRNGQAPFGIWEVAKLLVAPQWASSSDPSLDVGFVVLKAHDGRNIQQILGANRLNADHGYRYVVRVTGYPDSAEAPIACVNRTSRESASQLRIECGGYTGGTSGSPWVTRFNPRTRNGTIVGVIGGYQEGGSTADVSYSPILGEQVQQLYRQAEQAKS